MIELSESEADVAARLFRGFSDPTRLAILLSLLDGEHRVTDLVEITGRSQATVSGHVACLRGCGLVDSRVEGRQSYYRLASREVVDVLVAAQRLLGATGEAVRLCPVHLEPPR
jgi:DNA-binding transcriptional ArsR family regulator